MEHQHLSKGKPHRRVKEHQGCEGQNKPLAEAEYDGTATAITNSNLTLLALGALGADDKFVQRWLAQTETKNSVPGGRFNTEHQNMNQQPQGNFWSIHHEFYGDKNCHSKLLRKRRPCLSSSDSSLLEVASGTHSNPLIREGIPDICEMRGNASRHHRHRHNIEPSDGRMGQQSSNRRETFERRPRHKTRGNLYEPKKQRKPSAVLDRQNRSGAKQKKKRNRKRSTKTTEENSMCDFSSKRMITGRLTIRPTQRIGLFNNGRVSSFTRHRGLPDLASSEMTFLQRSIHAPTVKNQDKNENERRKAKRQHDEISTFFKPLGAALEETAGDSRSGASSSCVGDDHLSFGKSVSRLRYRKEYMRYEPADSSKRRDFGPGQLATLSDIVCTPSTSNLSKLLPRHASDTPSKWSRKDTTCLTWSDSQISPIIPSASRRLRNSGQHRTSSTPGSIRKSIKNTTVFRDTGRVSTLDLNQPQNSTFPGDTGQLRNLQTSSPSRNCSSGTCEDTISSSSLLSGSHLQYCLPGKASHSPRISISHVEVQNEAIVQQKYPKHLLDKARPKVEIPPARPKQVACEQNSADPPPYQDPICALPAEDVLGSKAPKECKSITPVTRKQFARKARVRCWSIKSPVAEFAEAELPQNGHEQHVLEQNKPKPPEVDQLSMLNSLVDSTVAPAIVFSYKDTERGYRAGGTGPPVRQDFTHKRPIISQTNSALHAAELSGRHSLPLPLDNVTIAQNSLSLGRNGLNYVSNTRSDSLPIRGSWIGWAGGMISGPSRLSLIPEGPPADIYQLQQMTFRETAQVPSGEERMAEERFEGEKDDIISYIDHIESNLWEREYAAVALRNGVGIYDEPDEGLEELQDYCGGVPSIPEIWEEQEQVALREVEDPEICPGQVNKRSNHQIIQENPPSSIFDPPNCGLRAGIAYEQANDVGEVIMQGFWRPRRNY